MIRVIQIILFLVVSVYAQDNGIKYKNSELKQLQSNISHLQDELKSLKVKTQYSHVIVKQLDKESHLLNKTILNLREQERLHNLNIQSIEDSISLLDSAITKLKTEYAKYVKWQFMYGRKSKLELLFSSSSMNESLMRMKYFDLISEQNENVNNNLENNKKRLMQLVEKLESERNYKRSIIQLNIEQVDKLNRSKKERRDLITKLQKDEKYIENEIDEKRKAEILIKQLIARLEEEERERERKRREQNLRGIEKTIQPVINYANFENFIELQGKLNWPVSNGKIIRNFGENKNSRLNTVTLNYGVDIQTRMETDVRCVAEGIVSAIEWIPGYGSVLIITHRGKFRTVYGHITDITVNEGDKVNGGDILGKVNSSLEGNILHFEVWNERNYQNPEQWLVKR